MIEIDKSFIIQNIEDQEDGSAILTIDMSYEMLKIFAKIGLLSVIEEAASKVLNTDG